MKLETLNKKKVLFVLDSLGSGGAEKDLVSVLTLIDKDKYDIDLLTFIKGGLYENIVPSQINKLPLLEYFEYLGPNKIKIPFSKSIRYFNNRIYAFALRRLYRLIVKLFKTQKLHPAQLNWFLTNMALDNLPKQYDVAIAFSQGLPTYFVAKKTNAKVKLCWINTDYEKAKYSAKFDAPFYDSFDKIINISPKGETIFLKHHENQKHKSSIIYNIISKKIIIKMSEEACDFPYGYKGIKLLTIGRLVPPKGYELAIQACEILKKKNINFKWYVIGEGPLKANLEKLVAKLKLKDYFVFLGTFPNPYPFIKKCDIYCQPSVFEGFGIALAEAKILCKPIVATNFEVVHNQLKNEENGLIVKMNPTDLANAIERLVLDEDLKNKFVENLKIEKVETEEEVKKIEDLLDYN